jgi:two-component system, chemotaxis family, CheB/CheR fusion protein
VAGLRFTLRKCISGDDPGHQVTLEAVNRRGKPIRCRVNCTPLRGPTDEMQGAILLMEEHADGAG